MSMSFCPYKQMQYHFKQNNIGGRFFVAHSVKLSASPPHIHQIFPIPELLNCIKPTGLGMHGITNGADAAAVQHGQQDGTSSTSERAKT